MPTRKKSAYFRNVVASLAEYSRGCKYHHRAFYVSFRATTSGWIGEQRALSKPGRERDKTTFLDL
jgi:hypothetical protein